MVLKIEYFLGNVNLKVIILVVFGFFGKVFKVVGRIILDFGGVINEKFVWFEYY